MVEGALGVQLTQLSATLPPVVEHAVATLGVDLVQVNQGRVAERLSALLPVVLRRRDHQISESVIPHAQTFVHWHYESKQKQTIFLKNEENQQSSKN